MVPVGDLFITEGFWDRFKHSLVGLLGIGGRKSMNVRHRDDSENVKTFKRVYDKNIPDKPPGQPSKLGFRAQR
jgi:hypothetical protein